MLVRLSRCEVGLILFSVLSGVWLVFAMPVFAQESYYWTYSQHLDLSYFDHPPMVAWLIGIGTSLLGDGAAGIRLATWLCGCGTMVLGLALLNSFGASRTARIAWLSLASSVPTLIATRFLATPDAPLACFWMATIVALWRARDGGLAAWGVAGAMAGCALLSKYTAVFLAVGGLSVLVVDPVMRRNWRRPGPYLGVAVATLTFSPVLIWNVMNDFESFRFQTSGRMEHAHLSVRWIGQLLAGQLGAINPFVAVLLPASVWWLWRLARTQLDPRALWLLAFGMPLGFFLLSSSLWVQVKINWLLPAMLPLLIGTALWWSESDFPTRRPLLARRLGVTTVIVGLTINVCAPAVVLFPQHRGTSWTGWESIAATAELWEERIDAEDGIEGNVFFFAGDYRDAAQLTRNLRVRGGDPLPGELLEPTLAQNVVGQKALQFDHWTNPMDLIGQDAVFVLPRPHQRQGFLDLVAARFSSVENVERLCVTRLGFVLSETDVFVCRAYKGPCRLQ